MVTVLIIMIIIKAETNWCYCNHSEKLLQQHCIKYIHTQSFSISQKD